MSFRKELMQKITNKYLRTIAFSPTVNCLLISIASTLLIYSIFYYFSEAIWSHYAHIDPMLLAPHMRGWVDHDGIETYVMYTLVFINICIVVCMLALNEYLSKNLQNKYSKFIFFSMAPLLIICAAIFFYRAGFHPPENEIGTAKSIWDSTIIVLFSVVALIKISRLPERWSLTIIGLVLIPICFLSTSALSVFDYGFVFSPALRLNNGFGIKEIYFQYDLFMSFLAAAWMKLHLDFNSFRVIPQAAIYALILAEFILAKRLFFNKKLAYFLLATLVLVKIYAYFIDPSYCIQLTPLRLDFWVIPFIIVMWRGNYSVIIGCALALINIFHRNFGFLYSISYIEYIFVLFVLDVFKNSINIKSIIALLKKHILLTYPNLLLIALSLTADYYIFGNVRPESALLYQQLGIGFMRISNLSFYWYVPILLAATFVLLFKQRKIVPAFYFNSGVFLILLSLANSVYFFGRSHESNVIHISGSLLFLVFLLMDLLGKKYCTETGDKSSINTSPYKKFAVGLMPILFIMSIAYFYSERITRNITTHAKNLYHLKFQYPIPYDKDTTDIRALTHNSDKVYIFSQWDFYYYYYGNYVPQGYFLPYVSWPFKKDLLLFLQNLINKNYYIVIKQDEMRYENEIVNALAYHHTTEDNVYKVIWK